MIDFLTRPAQCKFCGTTFQQFYDGDKGRPKLYCDAECRTAKMVERQRVRRKYGVVMSERPCATCGKPMTKAEHGPNAKWCSPECKSKRKRKRRMMRRWPKRPDASEFG